MEYSGAELKILNPYTLFTTTIKAFEIGRLSREGRSQNLTQLVIYVAMMRFQFSTILLSSGSITSGVYNQQFT